ncbi:hypothetical protein [Nocardioides nanhaiensis]|uniref:Uncharacterized protein n=1 Tax=Nocardioides nanhaiensis TaxID=1476871 RepID=A0ABP8WPB4_9ACTN
MVPSTLEQEAPARLLREGGRVLLGVGVWVLGMAISYVPAL